MPKSTFILFVSHYPHPHNLDVGDVIETRIAFFHKELRQFRIVRIEEFDEDGETMYRIYGVYLGMPVSK